MLRHFNNTQNIKSNISYRETDYEVQSLQGSCRLYLTWHIKNQKHNDCLWSTSNMKDTTIVRFGRVPRLTNKLKSSINRRCCGGGGLRHHLKYRRYYTNLYSFCRIDMIFIISFLEIKTVQGARGQLNIV